MALTGGKRDRMILEAYYRLIQTQLSVEGWFGPNRQHKPITMVDAYPDIDTEVALNTLAVSVGDTFQRMLELGSNAEERYQALYVDFFAESDALARHVAGDVYAILNENPVVSVLDLDKATPTHEFYAFIDEESVEITYPARATNAWLKHWVTVSAVLRDERWNE